MKRQTSSNRPFICSNLVEETLQGLSPIQTIMKMAEPRNIRAMGLRPEDVISFGGGWCNHKAPDRLQRIYIDIVSDEQIFHQSGRYSAIKGEYQCRDQIARYEKEIYGVADLVADTILLGQSSTQIFHDALRVLFNNGEEILVLDPTYANYINAVKCALPKSKLSYLPALDMQTWTYLSETQKTLETLQTACENGARGLIIPVPDNPTSQIPTDEFMRSCLEILADHNGFLIIDHAYKDLWFDNMPKCYSWSPVEHENLISLHSNSKWLSSLGRRLGWVEANDTIISGFEKLNESVLLSPDTMHSMATARFLSETLDDGSLRSFIDETRALYKRTSQVMIDKLENDLEWPYLNPQGGLYTCSPTPEAEDPIHFVQRVLQNTGVLLIPGLGFGPSMNKAVRLSYGPLCYDHEKIILGFDRINEYLKKS